MRLEITLNATDESVVKCVECMTMQKGEVEFAYHSSIPELKSYEKVYDGRYFYIIPTSEVSIYVS